MSIDTCRRHNDAYESLMRWSRRMGRRRNRLASGEVVTDDEDVGDYDEEEEEEEDGAEDVEL